jgi:hypothetical protein
VGKSSEPVGEGGVELYWLPLGAGDSTHCVRTNGRAFEALSAWRAHRDRRQLFHAALIVHVDGARYTVEMAPVWSVPDPDRGVACVGPVGLPWLGRSRWFRYEVRCWRDGVIPDLDEAVGGPRSVSRDEEVAARVLELLPEFPTATWGRDEQLTGDMWNSNSLVAWVLSRAGLDVHALTPPDGGRAPGWDAGVVVAAREYGSLGAVS